MPEISGMQFGGVTPTGYRRRPLPVVTPPPLVPQLPTFQAPVAVPGRAQQAYRRLLGPIYGDLLWKVIDWKNIGKVLQIADRELGGSVANQLDCEIESKKKVLRNTIALLNAEHEMWRAVCDQIAEVKGRESTAEVNFGTLISARNRAYEEKDRLEQKAFQLDAEIKNLERALRDNPWYSILISPRNIVRNIRISHSSNNRNIDSNNVLLEFD